MDASFTGTTVQRAVILSRGLGSRMRRADESAVLDEAQRVAASSGSKGMIPDGRGRPLLDHIVASLAAAGIERICMVVAPDAEAIRARYEHRRDQRIAVEFAVQPHANGTAMAVVAADRFVRGERFLVLNADNLYPTNALRDVARHRGPCAAGFARSSLERESGFGATRVDAFALLAVDEHARLTRIVEKPSPTQRDALGADPLISMNLWQFDDRILEACREVPLSERGEYELPQAVGLAVTRGVQIDVLPASGRVLDLSSRADIAAVASELGARELPR